MAILQIAVAALTNEQLLTLTHNQGKTKVIPVNDQNFQKILSGERDYHLVLLLSSAVPQINCVLCNEFHPDFNIVANSWFQDHPNGLGEEELNDEDSPKKNVYFLHSEFAESRQLFQLLQLNNIPKVYHFPPSSSIKANDYIKEFDEYQFYQGVHRELLASYLKSVTGLQFNIYIPPDYSRIAINAVFAFTFALLIRRYRKEAYNIATSRSLWSSIILVGVLLLISGYMFVQIRGVPYVREHANGRVDYFVPGQQNQLGVETQILSFVYGILSASSIILIKHIPKIKSPQVQLIAVVIISLLIFIFYSLLLSVFGLKGMGYPFRLLNFF